MIPVTPGCLSTLSRPGGIVTRSRHALPTQISPGEPRLGADASWPTEPPNLGGRRFEPHVQFS